jgi:hypothetical protein
MGINWWGERLEGSRFGACPTDSQISYATRPAMKRVKQAAPANCPALGNAPGAAEEKIDDAMG